MSGKLGEILLKENLITPDQLKQALHYQKANGGRLGPALVNLGFLNDDAVLGVLSRQYGVPWMSLAYSEADPHVTKLIPMETAMKYQVFPLTVVGKSLTLAVVDPTNVFAMDEIKSMTGFNIEPVLVSEAAIMEAIKKCYYQKLWGSQMSEKLGEMLLKENLITPDQLKQALEHQKANGGRLGNSLVKLGFLYEDEVLAFLTRQYGVPHINLPYFEVDPNVIKLIPMETAIKYRVLPLSLIDESLVLAMVDPTNVFARDELKFMTGLDIEPVVAPETAIMDAIKKQYGNVEDQERKKELEEIVNFIETGHTENLEWEAGEDASRDLAEPEQAAEDSPVIKLVNYILTDAVKRGASDIHMEPYENEYRVRYRIDGILRFMMTPPFKLRDAIIDRIKVMAKLDISEKRLPQDGRIKIKMMQNGKKKRVDFQVLVLPTLHGERIGMRLLDKQNLCLDMTKLGFEPESLSKFQKAIARSSGLVLVTGPRRSGKTNTLYAALSQLNKPDTNIVSIEKPVECSVHGFAQVQVKEQAGLTFASGLSSVLEQDPDVIMVGEIRDVDTAQLAVAAARAGHLILSSMPTEDDAPSALLLFLVNMGIKPFLVSRGVSLVCAQRLVRRICPDCKVPEAVAPQVLMDVGFTPEEAMTVQAYRGKGCATCNNTGYKGRVGLFEVMEMTDELRALIEGRASLADLRRKAEEQGMMTLNRSGLIKVGAGLTTLEEVLLQAPRTDMPKPPEREKPKVRVN